jgi:hypothetical protein
MFLNFDCERFLKEKTLMALAMADLNDSEGNRIGSKISTVIFEDKTDYGDSKVTNAGDSFKIKVLNLNIKPIKMPCFIRLVKPTAKVWGEYQNNLSITAQDIQIIEQ